MAAAVAARGAAPDDLDAAWSGQHPTFAELRSFQKAIELAAEGGAKPLASQIVLIGQESAAKSATISALVPGLNLLSGAGSTTKTPTVIKDQRRTFASTTGSADKNARMPIINKNKNPAPIAR